jgi:hypothetical protein
MKTHLEKALADDEAGIFQSVLDVVGPLLLPNLLACHFPPYLCGSLLSKAGPLTPTQVCSC